MRETGRPKARIERSCAKQGVQKPVLSGAGAKQGDRRRAGRAAQKRYKKALFAERSDDDFGFGAGAALRQPKVLQTFDEGQRRRPISGADGDAVVLIGEFDGLDGGDEVGFAEDADEGFGAESELFDDGFDGGDLGVYLRIGRVDDVEQDIGIVELFERRFEGGDEIFGKVADEADGIGEDDFFEFWEAQTAARRVERGKELIFGIDPGICQDVEKRRFSGVCVADEAENGDVLGVAFFALKFAAGLAVFELALQGLHAFAGFSAVHFEFCLARTAAAHAARQAAHGGVFVDEFGEIVFELREFDLELSVGGFCALGEDVEDELRAIEDFMRERLGDDARLRRGEFAIEDDEFGVVVEGMELDLLQFSRTDEAFGVGRFAALFDDAHDVDACRTAQFDHFFAPFSGIFFAQIEVDEDCGGAFGLRGGIGLGAEFGFDGAQNFVGILREQFDGFGAVSRDFDAARRRDDMGIFGAAGRAQNICFDRYGEIQTQFRKVGDFVGRQPRAGIVGVGSREACDGETDAAKAAKPGAASPDIGQIGPEGIAQNDAFDVTVAPDQNADFTMELFADARHAMGEIARYEEILRDAAQTERFERFGLARVETDGVSENRYRHGFLCFAGRA